MSDAIVNKVAESGLITLDPEQYYPKSPVQHFDIKDFLFRGMILKEKDFREAIKAHNWEQYRGQNVAVYCSADAIVPAWAYMLVASNLESIAEEIYFGTQEEMIKHIVLSNIQSINAAEFEGKRVVIKGCGDLPIGEAA